MRLTGDQKKFDKNFEKFRIFFSFVPNSGTVEENTWHFFKSFCYSWALDMAPTWAVPGLLTSDIIPHPLSCFSYLTILVVTWPFYSH